MKALPALISVFPLSLLLLVSRAEASPWNFEPKEARTFVDGPAPRHFYLQGEKRKVNFRVDPQTRVSGSAGATEFKFADLTAATLKLAASPLAEKKLPFDKNLPIYQEAALKLLPAGSTEIVLESEKDNAFPINKWTSHQYVFRYAYYGRALRSSITFLNYSAADQWIVQASASPADFENVAARTSNLLNTFDETDLSSRLEDLPN